MAQVFQAMILGPMVSEKDGRKLGNLAAKPSQEDLVFVKGLLETGVVKPVIDRSYPWSDLPKALRYYGKGRSRGKVVITVEHEGA